MAVHKTHGQPQPRRIVQSGSQVKAAPVFSGTSRGGLNFFCPLDKPAPPRQPAAMKTRSPRLAARALILIEDRLLMVNAYPGGRSDLWCAPGGGVMSGASLPDNLAREVHEECGLTIAVGAPALVNEFHDPKTGFHQVDLFFRCTALAGDLLAPWTDPEGVVTERRLFTRAELTSGRYRFKPDSLPEAAWGVGCGYDPLELIVP